MGNINIKELALHLNLSKSTVSRAFRGHSDINTETKERILKVARTIADLDNCRGISLKHLSEAITLRCLDLDYFQ